MPLNVAVEDPYTGIISTESDDCGSLCWDLDCVTADGVGVFGEGDGGVEAGVGNIKDLKGVSVEMDYRNQNG